MRDVMSHKLDSKDKQLISLLRMNARMSVVNLAKELGVSRATIQNRIKKLEQQGVILGYTVKLKAGVESHPVRLFVNVLVEAKIEAKVVEQLHCYPEVVAIHHTSGHWDLMVEIRAQTLPSLNALLGEIRLINGIMQTETNLLLDTVL
jgi:DNA-binding Lrp family transcriptional regulator